MAERHGGSHHHTRTGSRSGPLTANSSGDSARTGMMLSKRTIAGAAMMTPSPRSRPRRAVMAGKDFNNSRKRVEVEMTGRFASRYHPSSCSARPRASLRSVLLTRIDNAARTCRASRQMTGKFLPLSSCHSHEASEPVSSTMRAASDAFARRSFDNASVARMSCPQSDTSPPASRTHTLVSSIETSNPTYFSMVALLWLDRSNEAQLGDQSPGEQPPAITPCEEFGSD